MSPDTGSASAQQETRRWLISGRVQGVGFRPFVYRSARALGLSGWVKNLSGQVAVVARGEPEALEAFDSQLREGPPLARPVIARVETADPPADAGFRILASQDAERADVHVPPDLFTCDDCLAELQDPGARRHRYPFINCTQCGPRYTLIRSLPYDRPNTSMAAFQLCADCLTEYRDPADRRFHAQPLACPACGPVLSLRQPGGERMHGNEASLAAALYALRDGAVVAVKGVGGYHLICDATAPASVASLRDRKRRPHKPLAVLFPWQGRDGLDALREQLLPDQVQAQAVRSPERPIVLIPRRRDSTLAASLAPGLAEIGAMLPYSPLHHLLSADFGGPLVATSANLSGEPVLTEAEAVETRLEPVFDVALHHDRPIVRPADDSVMRVVAGKPRPMRLGRGLAPLELDLPQPMPRSVLALGGHMKVNVALGWGHRVVISPHIGDLDSPRGLAVFDQVAKDLQRLYAVRPDDVAHDAHPGYATTRYARDLSERRLHAVYHHHAHASALAAEHPDVARWLVFTWDGTGFGEDGTTWGGEALLGRAGCWSRVASLRPFHLPGGDRAAREPWRSAAALAWASGVPWRPSDIADIEIAQQAWRRGLNAPASSAAGRVFDAASALLGLTTEASFEGQGPMWLEALAAEGPCTGQALPLASDQSGVLRADWAPLVTDLLDTTRPPHARAGSLHARLAQTIVAQAEAIQARHGPFTVGLTGGVFQNRLLSDLASSGLRQSGFSVHLPCRIPCNDAGLSFGQIAHLVAAKDSRLG